MSEPTLDELKKASRFLAEYRRWTMVGSPDPFVSRELAERELLVNRVIRKEDMAPSVYTKEPKSEGGS